MPNGVTVLEKPITVVFFGVQGSGKGTQAGLLADYVERNSDTGILRIEMGERLRGFAAGTTHASKRVHDTLENGKLLPGFIPDYVLSGFFLQEFSGTEHMILDGVARKATQAIMMDEALEFFGRGDYQAVVLDLPRVDAIERLRLRGRSDDKTEEQIGARIDAFERDTLPAIAEIERRGRVIHHVDGRPGIAEIHQAVLTALRIA